MNTEVKARPEITLQQVVSSQIAAIGHDAATNTLAIQFPASGSRPATLYHYENFTAEKYQEFSAAESKGSYFIKHIKNNKEQHPYEKIS